MRRRAILLAGLVTLGMLGIAQAAPPTPRPSPSQPASIGSATMEKDGSIVLMLRAEDGKGAVGDARFVYKKSDPKYKEILDHVGGLRPGQSKPVPPWK